MDVARVQHEGDLSEVRGQPSGEACVKSAAAGGHNLLLYRPARDRQNHVCQPFAPASCRLHERRRSPAVGFGLFHQQSKALTGISSGACAPFAAPHHTASGVALVGGGSLAQAWGISLARMRVFYFG